MLCLLVAAPYMFSHPMYFILPRWLQPDSFVDPKKCDLICIKDDIKCGWPTLLTILTKDQYGEVVHVPNLKVGIRFFVGRFPKTEFKF